MKTELEQQLEQQLAQCREELAAERLHNIRSTGYAEMWQRQTTQQILSMVRHGTANRLVDIKIYADRPNPNRDEILELVQEIQDHLAKIEEKLL